MGPDTCADSGAAAAMGLEETPVCNACVQNTAGNCEGQNIDGCFCVRNWPVLGVEALAKAGVKTFVVGFGDKVDALTLNQAAVAGGDPIPNCDPNSNEASCYLKADNASELSGSCPACLGSHSWTRCWANPSPS